MALIQYHKEILERFPNTAGGMIRAQGVKNASTPPELLDTYSVEQQATLERIGKQSFGDIPALSAWRSTFRGFNVEPTKYRSSVEALLRRLRKHGDIPSINALVDIGNLISIRYLVPVAVFDTRAVQGAVTVHFAEGDKRYTGLHDTEAIHPEVGEVVFSDETGLVIARRWCWRQSKESAAGPETSDILITIETQLPDARNTLQDAVNDMLDLLKSYAGGTFTQTILHKDNPVFEG